MLKFFAEKMWVAFAVQKLLIFFSAKNIRILYIESAKIVNKMTLNKLVKNYGTTIFISIFDNEEFWAQLFKANDVVS